MTEVEEEPLSWLQGRRRAIAALALALLLAAGAVLLIGQVASFSHLRRALAGADLWWLAVSLAAALAGYAGYALMFRAIVRAERGPRPSLRLVLRLTVAVLGASVIATSAGRLGSEYWSIRRMHEARATAWSRVLALNTAAWAALGVLAMLAAAVVLAAGGWAPLWLELTWLMAAPACALPALYLSSPARADLGADRGGRLRRVAAAVLRGLSIVRSAGRRRRSLGELAGGALLYWGGDLVALWAALRAFGVHLGYGRLVLAFATGYASTMLPLPAGGAGGVDAASTYSLTLVGVSLGPALLATVVQRLATYWLPLVLALVSLRSIRRLPEQLASVSTPTGSGRLAAVPDRCGCEQRESPRGRDVPDSDVPPAEAS